MKYSIIIPVKNLRMITQMCLDSIERYTKDYELIIVDDGSDKETRQFLLEEHRKSGMTIIRNEKSVGWCKTINQGSEEAKGDYVILLNNDVVVTPDWAEKMLAHFKKDKKLGILGCTTNKVEGYQHVEFNKKGIDYQYADSLTGFCLMISRKIFDELIKKDGYLLDERFGLGGQDDADLTYRIRLMGYQAAIARDVFIYHYGSATFREEFNHDADYSHKYAQSRVGILRDKYKNIVDNKIINNSINAQHDNVNKRFIMIAVPNMGWIDPELVQLLITWTHNENYRVRIHLPEGSWPINVKRNECVKEFLKYSNHPDDKLWFIDDDVVPPIDALNRLDKADKDAISGLAYVMKSEKGEYFPYPPLLRYNKDKDFIVHYGRGIEEIDGCGGGCIMIKRKVFETMSIPYEWKYYPDGTLNLVADFHFCQKLQDNGFKLWADYDLICDHKKRVSLKGIAELLNKVSNE